jgi:hypothetical protein
MKHSLILLFGMPRSGTTWIAKIFDSHPNTLYRHEPDSGGALKPIPLIAPVADAERYQAIIAKFTERLPQIRTSRVAGSLPLFPKQYQSSAHLLLRRFSVLATKASEAFVRDVPIPEFIDYEKVRNLHVVWKSSVFKDPAASSTKWQTQLSPDQIERIMSIVRKSCFGERYADNCSREQLRYA